MAFFRRNQLAGEVLNTLVQLPDRWVETPFLEQRALFQLEIDASQNVAASLPCEESAQRRNQLFSVDLQVRYLDSVLWEKRKLFVDNFIVPPVEVLETIELIHDQLVSNQTPDLPRIRIYVPDLHNVRLEYGTLGYRT